MGWSLTCYNSLLTDSISKCNNENQSTEGKMDNTIIVGTSDGSAQQAQGIFLYLVDYIVYSIVIIPVN